MQNKDCCSLSKNSHIIYPVVIVATVFYAKFTNQSLDEGAFKLIILIMAMLSIAEGLKLNLSQNRKKSNSVVVALFILLLAGVIAYILTK